MLIHLRPSTVTVIFAGADLTFFDHGQLYGTLRKLIKEKQRDAVECFEQVFQQVLKQILQSAVTKDRLPRYVTATEDEVDSILRSNSDYFVCVFIRYFRSTRFKLMYMHSKQFTGFSLLTQQTYMRYHKQVAVYDDDISNYLQPKAKDENAAVLWQRFLRCLITVDTDLTVLDELLNMRDLKVFGACLVSDVYNKMPIKKFQELFNWAFGKYNILKD